MISGFSCYRASRKPFSPASSVSDFQHFPNFSNVTIRGAEGARFMDNRIILPLVHAVGPIRLRYISHQDDVVAQQFSHANLKSCNMMDNRHAGKCPKRLVSVPVLGEWRSRVRASLAHWKIPSLFRRNGMAVDPTRCGLVLSEPHPPVRVLDKSL